MDILILADFCGRFDGKDNSRFLYLANILSSDHDVEILTSDFDHGTKKYFENIPEKYPFKITMVHEGMYVRNVSLRRFLGHYIWSRNVKKYLQERKKPDVIYAAVPPLSAPYEVAKYCKKQDIRFVVDIQDLWPEAFKMVFKIPVVSDIIFKPFGLLANAIYISADSIIGVSETYVNRALSVNRKCKKGVTVYLGTELALFDENVKNNPVEKKNELWLGYCGSMGDSYDLVCVIDALAQMNNPPKFIAMGDGQKKKEFEEYAREKKIDCIFTGKLPYEKMCGWVSKCDMVVNPIRKSSAASIINKHGDYAASGLPVLNTQDSAEYRQLVDSYQMGFNCINGNSKDLAEKMAILVEDKNLRLKMGQNARKCAEERFDRRRNYDAIVSAILGG